MKVKLTKSAYNDLAQIVKYYTNKNKGLAGRKLRAKILSKIIQLQHFPNLGKADEIYSKKYEKDCRVLIFDNYKIIYYIDEDTIIIMILNIFDTRQSPDKL